VKGMSEVYKMVKPISLYISITGIVMIELKKGDYDAIKNLLKASKLKFTEVETESSYIIKFQPPLFEIWCAKR
jgi:methylase of polypeptide subunit release factors